ncbi:MAG: Mpo1-like protein [Stellaceae bacterium]
MSYSQFWRRYLGAHRDARTRGLHYLGTSCGLAALAAAAATRDWRWLPAAPVVGYGCAWLGHLAFEHNRPETFGHPLWSLASDLRMLALFASGRLGVELRRAGTGDSPGTGDSQ